MHFTHREPPKRDYKKRKRKKPSARALANMCVATNKNQVFLMVELFDVMLYVRCEMHSYAICSISSVIQYVTRRFQIWAWMIGTEL